MHPISLRKKGIYNDRACLSELSLNKYALRSIKTPSLVIHAADDSLQPLSHGSNTARNIEGSQFLVFDTGGHFLIGHQHDVRVKVNDFIKRTMPIAENR
jgi:pimeloyl-ACP methyl ester carboxylesterase